MQMGVKREFEGRTLEEVLEIASRELGIPTDDIHYRLVEEGRRGVFGLGARQVRIRVEAGKAAPRRTPADVEIRETDPETAKSPGHAGVEDTVTRMVGLMGLDLSVSTEGSSEGVKVLMTGNDRRLLLQKDGQLVSAIQFVLNRMARRAWPDVARIRVQCGNQRGGRRDDELIELVREVARQVTRTGQAKKLHPMNPYERRLAHLTVREFPALESWSEGDGFLKKVTVTPVARDS